MKHCTKCLLPEGKFSVSMTNGEPCNYCAFYDQHAAQFTDYAGHKPLLEKRLASVKGRFDYDALVGLSGGKDSTYVLYRLVKEYGARVLVITYENGFLTDLAKKNIDNTIRKLGVDHFYHYPDWNVHKLLYRVCLEKLGDPCLACAFAGYFLALKVCSERRIPFFVAGRSPSQMFRNFFEGSKDLFIPMIQTNLQEHSFEKVAAVYRKLNDAIKGWVSQIVGDDDVIRGLHDEFYIDSSKMTADFAPEILSFFLYEPYDEEAMKQTLERELGYQRKSGDGLLTHLDCGIHDAAEHLYGEIHGISMVAQEVAVMRRRNELTVAEAEELLARRAAPSEIEQSVETLCERIGMDVADFPGVIERLKKNPPSKFASR